METQTKNPRVDMILDLEDDELPFVENGTTKNTAVSVEQYNEDRESQLCTDLHDCYDYEDLRVLNSVPQDPPFGRRNTEKTESSDSNNDNPFRRRFFCNICVEPKSANESFSIKGCSHSYCTECMTKYVASKLQENITSIPCPSPNCKGVLEPQYCRNLLPPDVFDRWGNALCEAIILGDQKFYCPFKDCSALLIDDGGLVVRESECPYCRRLFCAQCKVPWHSDISCAEFQKLNKNETEREDIMLMNLAKNKKWKRCPNCKIYVEKKDGCMYMMCRAAIQLPTI